MRIKHRALHTIDFIVLISVQSLLLFVIDLLLLFKRMNAICETRILRSMISAMFVDVDNNNNCAAFEDKRSGRPHDVIE